MPVHRTSKKLGPISEPLRVENHRLVDESTNSIRYSPTPRMRGKLEPRFVIIHFTVGQSAEAAASWMSRKSPGPSAHLIIGRNGSVIQLAPFNRITFHCGPSQWGELQGLDRYAIGIELDNAGPMTRKAGKWVFTFGNVFPDEEVVEAKHKHGGKYKAWHTYTDAQIVTLIRTLRGIVEAYEIEEILGHDDISPERKWDPGPAFPMALVRKRVFERKTQKDLGEKADKNVKGTNKDESD